MRPSSAKVAIGWVPIGPLDKAAHVGQSALVNRSQRAVLVTMALLVAGSVSCTTSSNADPDSSGEAVPTTSPPNAATTTEFSIEEPMKECPLSSLTAIDALVTVVANSNTLVPVEPAIGGSAVASVRVTQVLWPTLSEIEEGDVFDGLIYAHSTTAAQWGFDDEWLEGETRLVTGLARNQIREVDVPWELPSVLVGDDGSLRFPIPCFTTGFQQLADRVNRPADLSLYVDLLEGAPPVLEAAEAIDDEPLDQAAGVIERPFVDPGVCGSGAVSELESKDITYFPFALDREQPIPLQVLASATSGVAKPFAVVLRLSAASRDFEADQTVVINDAAVGITMRANGNAEAAWALPDGTKAYMRSRDLDEAEMVALITRLAPRPADAAIPGFGLQPSTDPNDVVLLHEHLNTGLSGTVATFQCEPADNQGGYRIQIIDGDPVFVYFGIIDAPRPYSVGSNGDGAITIWSIRSSPSITLEQVVNADPATWAALPTISSQTYGHGTCRSDCWSTSRPGSREVWSSREWVAGHPSSVAAASRTRRMPASSGRSPPYVASRRGRMETPRLIGSKCGCRSFRSRRFSAPARR